MDQKKRHFRFPVFTDEQGAKGEASTVEASLQAPVSSHPYIEKPAISYTDKTDKRSQSLLRRSELKDLKVDEAIEDELVKERLKQSQQGLVSMDESVETSEETPFPARIQREEEKVEEERQMQVSLPERRKQYATSDYRSFANEMEQPENTNEDGTTADIDRIPQIKRNMQRSRENMQDAVPFRRKQKERHKKS